MSNSLAGTVLPVRPRAHILLAVPQPELRADLARTLETQHAVSVAEDGQDALAGMVRHAPDLVLTVGPMPRLDGLGLLVQVRGDVSTGSIPVVLLCAAEEEQWRVNGLQAGADDCITVPCGPQELLQRVDTILRRSRVRGTDGTPWANAGLLRAFISQSRDGVIIVDGQGTVLEWNRGEEEITGIPRAEALGRPIWDVQFRLAPQRERDTGFRRQAMQNALLGLQEGVALRRSLEEEIQRPDGTRRTVHSILFGIPNGREVLVGCISRDVTARRQVEQQLREERTLLTEAESLARLGHWHLDLRSGQCSWSHEMYRILGRAPGSVPAGAEEFLQAVVPEDRARVAGELAATSCDEVTRGLELTVTRVDGVRRGVHATMEVLRDGFGAPARLMVTVLDITERKALEQSLADANRHKDEFLAMLSHELRNPLAVLRGSLGVLARTEPRSPQGLRMQEILDRQVSQLTRLVDDLLDVTRISRGKVRLQQESVDLGALVQQTLQDHQPLFAAAGIHLAGPEAPGPLWLLADAARLTQALGNLLTNAAKFTPPGGRVEVGVERQDGAAVLRVRDTGAGIAPELLPRVFDAFVQGDVTPERVHGGLGLGLAVVKGLVELHGGSVAAHSAGDGCGAEFQVRLPLGAAAAPPRVEPVALTVPPRRVLVIEDNPDTAACVQALLELEGHAAQAVHDARDGLTVAHGFQPELVLCDLGLPGMDGYAFARAVRADQALRGMFLVAVSGYTQPEDRERARQAGFDGHLAKPLTLEGLQEFLRQPPRPDPTRG